MTKHPIKRYIDHVKGSEDFAAKFAKILVERMNSNLRAGAVPFERDQELERRIERHAKMSVDVEKLGDNFPENQPNFASRKEKSDFDEVYEYLVGVSWPYQEARAAQRKAAGRKPHYPRMLYPVSEDFTAAEEISTAPRPQRATPVQDRDVSIRPPSRQGSTRRAPSQDMQRLQPSQEQQTTRALSSNNANEVRPPQTHSSQGSSSNHDVPRSDQQSQTSRTSSRNDASRTNSVRPERHSASHPTSPPPSSTRTISIRGESDVRSIRHSDRPDSSQDGRDNRSYNDSMGRHDIPDVARPRGRGGRASSSVRRPEGSKSGSVAGAQSRRGENSVSDSTPDSGSSIERSVTRANTTGNRGRGTTSGSQRVSSARDSVSARIEHHEHDDESDVEEIPRWGGNGQSPYR